jgi:glutathione synthase/RimK-type ligase-like ATP-grasp enzyme
MSKILILRRPNLGRTSTRNIKAFSRHQATMVIRKPEQKIPNHIDLLIRWGTTTQVPKATLTLNKATAIALSANKKVSRKIFAENFISIPKTYFQIETIDKFPVIVRPYKHSRGKFVFECNNYEELGFAIQKLKLLGHEDYYISEYIDKVKEFGIFVFDGKVTSLVEKKLKDPSKPAIAWNVATGDATFKNVRWANWPLPACKLAVDAVKALKLDFGRVDLIEDAKGKFYVLEVNSAHSLTSPYRQSCFAKALDYFIENGRIPASKYKKFKTYKFFIHPAIKGDAEED